MMHETMNVIMKIATRKPIGPALAYAQVSKGPAIIKISADIATAS